MLKITIIILHLLFELLVIMIVIIIFIIIITIITIIILNMIIIIDIYLFVFSTKYSLYRTYELLYADDGNGHNAMYWAADLGDVNIIEYLIRRNLDPRIPDSIGVTPLHISSEKGKYDAVIFLIKCGCDPTLKDLNGNSPFSIVRKSNNGKLLSEMKKQFRLQNKENGNGNGNRGERERERGRIESIFCDVCGINQYYVERIFQRKTCPSSTILVGIEGSTCRGRNSNEEEKYLELEDGVGSKDLMRNSRRDMGDPILSPQGCYRNGISLFKGVEGKGKLKPHALRRLNPSRFSYCFIYCIVIVAYWVLSISIPYYGWIALVFGSMFLFRLVDDVTSYGRYQSIGLWEISVYRVMGDISVSGYGRYQCIGLWEISV